MERGEFISACLSYSCACHYHSSYYRIHHADVFQYSLLRSWHCSDWSGTRGDTLSNCLLRALRKDRKILGMKVRVVVETQSKAELEALQDLIKSNGYTHIGNVKCCGMGMCSKSPLYSA